MICICFMLGFQAYNSYLKLTLKPIYIYKVPAAGNLEPKGVLHNMLHMRRTLCKPPRPEGSFFRHSLSSLCGVVYGTI